MCQFTGTRLVSNAKKGRCTDTSGYISNAEINEIIGASSDDPEIDGIKAEYWHDHGSNSDMLLYEDTEWVAYMSETTRETRRQHWANFNFGGTIDWAIDLRFFSMDDMRNPKTGDYPKDTQPLPPALADCNANYDTLEKIRDADNIPEHCAAIYAVEVLAKKLKDAMKTYDDLIKSGYDKKFDTYADAVVGGSTKAVREYVYNNGEKYFTCTVTESVECCKTCSSVNECKRCSNADDICKNWSPICDNPQGNDPILICDTSNTWLNISMPCPPDYSQRNYVYRDMRGMFPATYWDIRRDKESEFWAELVKTTGIAKDDVHMKNLQSFNDCHSGADPTNRCANVGWDYNFPVPDGYQKDDVTNPKTIVSDAYSNLQDIVRDLPKAAERLRKGTYDGLATDLADAVALPVFMIEEAVNGIKSISDAIDEANKEREKNIILAFLSAIFFFVPIVGQLVGTVAALANVARIIAILGLVGEVAIDIYSVVDTKGNDPLVIFGLVLAPLAIFDIAKIAKAAAVARTMKQEDVSKLGKGMKDKMDVYKGAVGKHRVCLLKPKSKRGVDVFPDGGMPMSTLNGDAVWSGDFQ
jgi:chitinase